MIKSSFENRFGFEKSLAAVWRILEMAVNTDIGRKLGLAIVRRELVVWTKAKVKLWRAGIKG